MFDNKKSTEVEFNYDLGGFNRKVLTSVTEVLDIIDQLTQRGGQDPLIINVENEYFEKILKSLRNGIEELDEEEKKRINRKLDDLTGGIYDLDSITYDSPESILLIGKIFSAQRSYQKRYVGAFGMINTEANKLLAEYDKIAEEVYSEFPYIREDIKEDFNENKSEINCIDVYRFAGDFTLIYKPISLFYTGTKSREAPIQSKVAFFTNIYFRRYEEISELLGKNFIYDFYDESVSRDDINKILMYWLRGHDLGHFFGRDVLGKNLKDKLSTSKEDNRRVYYILHELKSDMVSLYILKNKVNELFDGFGIEKVYQVFISELFRYMRRGHMLHYSDGGSAYLAYKYFMNSGALKINYNNKHDINTEQLSSDIDALCEQLVDIFEKGNSSTAVEFVRNLASFENLITKELPEDLEFLEDRSLPYSINISNNPSI